MGREEAERLPLILTLRIVSLPRSSMLHARLSFPSDRGFRVEMMQVQRSCGPGGLPLLITFREADTTPTVPKLRNVGFLGKALGRYGRPLIMLIHVIDKIHFEYVRDHISIGDELYCVSLS